MGRERLFSWLLLLLLILTTAAGCKVSEPAAVELIPQDANLIANIQVSKVINDQDLRSAYDEVQKEAGQSRTVEEALNELVKETGFDLRDCSQATVFADVTTLQQADYVGVLIEGTFDQKEFIDKVKKEMEGKFTTSDYKGYELFIQQEEDFVITILSDTMLLLGTVKAVKDVIDVNNGDRMQVSDTILDTYNQLGDALIKVAFEYPEQARKELAEQPVPGEMPISPKAFADMDLLGFALNKEAETISVRINLHFLGGDSAQDAGDTINGAIMLFKGTLEIPEMKELLGKIEVAVIDESVTIALDMTLSEVEELIETFQQ